jgi:hypothetical protein
MPYGYNEKILHVNISDARREAVPFYCDTLATKALERSSILGGEKQ